MGRVAAVFLLSERLTIWRVSGLALGFLGVVVLVWPDLFAGGSRDDRVVGYGICILTAALSSFALLMVRSLNRTESPGEIALHFVLASMVGALFTLYWGWVINDPYLLKERRRPSTYPNRARAIAGLSNVVPQNVKQPTPSWMHWGTSDEQGK